MTRVLIAGVSARAAAESAAREGFAVTAIDAFGDLDMHPSVQAFSLPRDVGGPFSARAAARAARDIECDAVAYLSNFENHPAAVSALGAGRALWGNAPAVLRRVRDPVCLADAFRRRGIPAPAIRMNPPNDPNDPNDWLIKPLSSGGGHRIRSWSPVKGRPTDLAIGDRVHPVQTRTGDRVPRGCYLQERIDGTPGSVVFVAAGRRAVPLGASRQLVGDTAFGAHGYRHCGNILAAAGDPQFADDEAIVEAASALHALNAMNHSEVAAAARLAASLKAAAAAARYRVDRLSTS